MFTFHNYLNIYIIKRSNLLRNKYMKFNLCIIVTFGLFVQNILEDIQTEEFD